MLLFHKLVHIGFLTLRISWLQTPFRLFENKFAPLLTIKTSRISAPSSSRRGMNLQTWARSLARHIRYSCRNPFFGPTTEGSWFHLCSRTFSQGRQATPLPTKSVPTFLNCHLEMCRRRQTGEAREAKQEKLVPEEIPVYIFTGANLLACQKRTQSTAGRLRATYWSSHAQGKHKLFLNDTGKATNSRYLF